MKKSYIHHILFSNVVCPECNGIGESIGRPIINIGLEDIQQYIQNLMNSQNVIEKNELQQIRNMLGVRIGRFRDEFDQQAQFFEMASMGLAIRADSRGILFANSQVLQDEEMEEDEDMEDEQQTPPPPTPQQEAEETGSSSSEETDSSISEDDVMIIENSDSDDDL